MERKSFIMRRQRRRKFREIRRLVRRRRRRRRRRWKGVHSFPIDRWSSDSYWVVNRPREKEREEGIERTRGRKMNLSSTFSSPLSTSHSLWLPASTVFIHLSPSTLHLSCSQPSISPFRPLFLSLICQSLLFFFYTLSSSFLRSSISCSLPPSLSVDKALCPSSESSGQVWINLPDKQRAKERKKERENWEM